MILTQQEANCCNNFYIQSPEKRTGRKHLEPSPLGVRRCSSISTRLVTCAVLYAPQHISPDGSHKLCSGKEKPTLCSNYNSQRVKNKAKCSLISAQFPTESVRRESEALGVFSVVLFGCVFVVGARSPISVYALHLGLMTPLCTAPS